MLILCAEAHCYEISLYSGKASSPDAYKLQAPRLTARRRLMHTTHIDIEDAHCTVTYGSSQSPLTLSVTPLDAKFPLFGSMIYAVPRQGGSVSSVLVSNPSFEEQCVLLAKLASIKFQRPVFLNSSVEPSMFLCKKLIDAVEATINKP